MATIATLMVKIGGDISGLTTALAKAESRLSNVGKSMVSVGKKASIGLTLPIVGAGAAIIKTGMDFEAAMSGVTSLMSPAEKQAEQTSHAMHDLALKMGQETSFGATDAAKAIEELIKAGVSTEAIMNGGLKSALDLAVAGELDLASAAEIASTALNSFAKDNLTVEQAANILAGAANASATSVSELKFSLSAVASVAAGAGQSFNDTSTALAVLAQNGLKGSDAGTSLKTMLMNLQPTTKAAANAMYDLGLMTASGQSAFINANGTFKSLGEIAGILQTSLQGLTDAQRMQALETIFGSDAIRAANILYQQGTQGFTNMQAAMANVTAAETAKEKMNNLKGSIEQLKGSLETMAVKIFEANDGPLKGLVDMLQNLVTWFSNLSPGMQQTILIVAGVVAAIGPLIMMLGMAAQGISVLGVVIGFLISPIGLIVLAIAALVAGIVYLWNTNEVFRQFIVEVWGAILDVINTAIQAIVDFAKPLIDDMVKFFTDKFTEFQAFWNTLWPGADLSFKDVWNGMVKFLTPLVEGIVAFLKLQWEAIKIAFHLVWGIIKEEITVVWNAIKGIIDGSLKVIKGFVELFTGVFTGDWKKAWEGVKDIVVGIWDVIKSVIKGGVNAIIGLVNGMIDGLNAIKIKVPEIDLPVIGKVGGGTIGLPNIPKIPYLETGTNYFPKDGLAYLHQGEAVVPKKYNNGGSGGSGQNIINVWLDGKLISSEVDNGLGGRLGALGVG